MLIYYGKKKLFFFTERFNWALIFSLHKLQNSQTLEYCIFDETSWPIDSITKQMSRAKDKWQDMVTICLCPRPCIMVTLFYWHCIRLPNDLTSLSEMFMFIINKLWGFLLGVHLREMHGTMQLFSCTVSSRTQNNNVADKNNTTLS